MDITFTIFAWCYTKKKKLPKIPNTLIIDEIPTILIKKYKISYITIIHNLFDTVIIKKDLRTNPEVT